MKKLCLSCFSKIPILASRCPNCIKGHQSVRGRTIFLIMLFVALGIMAKCVMNNSEKQSHNYKWSSQLPVIEKRVEAQKPTTTTMMPPEKPILRINKPAKKMSRKELLKLLDEI